LGSFAAAEGLVGINSPALIADQHNIKTKQRQSSLVDDTNAL